MTEGFVPTPPELVEALSAHALTALERRRGARLLDPACGDGAFLLGIARRWGRGRSPAARERLLRERVFGVELDPNLAEQARTRLAAWALGPRAGSRRRARLSEALRANVRVGCALSGRAPGEADPGQPPADAPGPALHWEQAFPQLGDGFDLVLGNPPFLDSEYLGARRPRWRAWLRARYATARGNWDLFCPFVERAWRLTRPGGVHGFVAPNALAGAPYASEVRRLLTGQAHLLVLGDAADAFREGVYPLFYVARREPPGAGPLRMLTPAGPLELPRRLFGAAAWPWAETRRARELGLLELGADLPRLETLTEVRGAATVAEAYALAAAIRDEPHPAGDAVFRLVNSGTIDPHTVLWGRRPLRYLGRRWAHPVIDADALQQLAPRRLGDARRSKVIVAGNTRRLEAVADPSGELLAGKSTTVVLARGELSADYLAGVLNSAVASFLYRLRFGSLALAGGYLRVGPPQLRALPVPPPARDPAAAADLCQRVAALRAGDVQASAQVDRLAARLYGVDPDLSLG